MSVIPASAQAAITFSNNPKPNQIMKKSIVNSRFIAGVLGVAIIALLLGFLSFVPNSQAQESPAPTEQTASQNQGEPAGPAKHNDKTFFEVLKEGGIVMIPLAAVSVYMLTLIIDSVRRIQNKVVCPPDIVNLLRSQFSAGDYNAAFQTCRSKACFLTNVVRADSACLDRAKKLPKSRWKT